MLFSLFFLFSLKIKLLIVLSHISQNIGFGFLEVVFQHASHSVQLVSLVGIHLFLHFFLLLLSSLLFHLFVQPLFLLVLKEFLASIILYVYELVLRSSPSNSRHPEISLFWLSLGKFRKYVSLVRFMEVIKISQENYWST